MQHIIPMHSETGATVHVLWAIGVVIVQLNHPGQLGDLVLRHQHEAFVMEVGGLADQLVIFTLLTAVGDPEIRLAIIRW